MKRRDSLLWTVLLAPDSEAGAAAAGGNQPASSPDASAAEKVLSSEANEGDASELIKTKRELEEERKKSKKHELFICELQDENKRLKTPPTDDKAAKQKKSFLDGLTFWG